MIGVVTRVENAEVTGLLRQWMPRARWFTGKANADFRIGAHALLAENAGIRTAIYLVDAGGLTFSVPLTFKPHGSGVAVFDATDDADGQRALLAAAFATPAPGAGGLTLTSHPTREASPIAEARKLTSEQSNTSIIYRFAEPDDGAAGIILKVFRVLSDGSNPDVELQQALDGAGSRAVPRQYGSVSGRWDGKHTDVLVAQEFLVGATDAWQVITDELARTASFTQRSQIEALGALTRGIHDELATAFPTLPATDQLREELVKQWRERAEKAIADAPELEEYRADIERVFTSALDVPWPHLQRIHGDFHLGQVLHVPERGWLALDFEGEPLRPLSERVHPDLALRDVAGMLRSFDYAGGSALLAGADSDQIDAWTAAAKAAYVAGYGELDAHQNRLLSALILDKALYEVSYETASRPSWVQLPLRGVIRLISDRK